MTKTYKTMQGDMWDSIAYSQLGDASYMDKLINLNMEYRNYYIFPAGIILTLPDIDEIKTTSSVLPPWKKVRG
jgi:phage tail protein X